MLIHAFVNLLIFLLLIYPNLERASNKSILIDFILQKYNKYSSLFVLYFFNSKTI